MISDHLSTFDDGKMDQSDYRELRDECQPKITALKGKLSWFAETKNKSTFPDKLFLKKRI
ncbi:MAG TPA: hypothetical protein VNW49_00375 [Puia sp.]|nr:hypothetical protein [Puia sp.]